MQPEVPNSQGKAIVAHLTGGNGPLSSAPADWLTELAAAGKLVHAEIGRVLLPPGKLPQHVFVIVSGRVRLLAAGPSGMQPELLETLQPGGVAGVASLFAGEPVEAATAAEDTVCLMVEKDRFRELLSRDPQLSAALERAAVGPDLYSLLARHFADRALDLVRVRPLARAATAQARVERTEQSEQSDFCWWIAEGPRRGTAWTHEDGAVRRIGVPAQLLEQDGYLEALQPIAESTEPLALPPAEKLLDPLTEYPLVTTQDGSIDEVVACYEMVSKFFGKTFPRDAVRRVLVNEIPNGRQPSLNACGNVAAMAGLAAQLVQFPSTNLGRIEAPALIIHDGAVCVIYQAGKKGIVFADPRSGLKSLPTEEFRASVPSEVQALLLRPLPHEENEKFSFRWFLPAIRKHKRVLAEVFVASFFIQLLGLSNPLLTQIIIDKVLVQNSLSALNVLGILFVVIAVASVALTAARTYLFVDTTNRIDLSLGSRIMDHLYKLRLGYFQKRPVGEVSSRLNELENIRNFLTGTALTVGLDAVFSVVYIGIMLFYDVKLTLVALLVIPFMAGVTAFCAPILRRQIRRRAEEHAKSQAHLIETLTGVQTVKAGNIEQHSRWEWQKRYAGFVSAGFHAVLTSTAMNSSTTLFSRLGDLAVLWYGAVLVIRGEMTLGQLIAFRIIAGYVTTPLMRLAQSWQSFQEVALSVERLGDVLDSPPEQTAEESGNVPMPELAGKVAFDSVTFSYAPGQQPVLRNVSFEVPSGSFVGVVGKSGSGKSTVLKLLPRLYAPDSGRVLVDGYEIAKVELYSLRRQIGTVLQDSLLFNSSVYANISIGDPDATPEEVMRAARVAGAHDFIMALPQGYNTPVGEQGRALSGGQRQRIAIARAVLQRPRLVILDEATSALDFPSENLVCKNLIDEFRGRTVFFVTHRVRSVEQADHILVFDNGRLVEQGKHADLMALRGYYYGLHTGAPADQ